jgi:hypothetical protein
MRRLQAMILPPFERPSRTFPTRLGLRDARIPRLFSFDRPAELVAHWAREDGHCPDARHLWDAVIATGDVQFGDDESEHLPFRLHLTCVRCGAIYRLAGRTDEDDCRLVGSIDPVPLQVGGLRAQQVEDGGTFGSSLWSLHAEDGAPVGDMSSGITMRGRRYVTGHVHGMAPLEAPTAHSCLRRLAVLHAGPGGRSGEAG